MHSITNDVVALRRDLRNIVNHVYNDHTHCSPTFCKVAAQTTDSNITVPSTSEFSSSDEDGVLGTINSLIVEEAALHNEEEEARGPGDDISLNRSALPDDLYFRIQRACDRLVSLAPQLISNSTSNAAECLMNIRCKFDGGKYFNRIQRGSFNYRTYGAGIRYQLGPDWTTQIWSRVTGLQPSEIQVHHGERAVTEHRLAMKRKATSAYKSQRKKQK